MNTIGTEDVRQFVNGNIVKFHESKSVSLNKLKLKDILKRKNPYLFKAKNVLTAQDLVKSLLDAHLSSQEESLFGDFLEALSIYVCGKAYNGKKSAAEGIDLEFDKDNVKYIVAIKSGPNWGNSSQINKMKENFRKAKRILQTGGSHMHIEAVNGCCYGKDDSPNKDEYSKLCGQNFWEFISGNKDLYIEIIEPLGHKAKEHNDAFGEVYARIINQFSFEFISQFCNNGAIDWVKLVQFNSGRRVT